MGGICVKEEEPVPLTPHENRYIKNCFRILSHDRDYLTQEDLQAWSYLADSDYIKFTRKACFRYSERGPIKLKSFAKHFYAIVKGNITEKATYIVKDIFGNTDELYDRVTTVQMHALVTSILRSYFIVLNQNKPPELISWNQRGVDLDYNELQLYSHFIIARLTNNSSVDILQLERWLFNCQVFSQIWREVLISLCDHLNPIKLPLYPGYNTIPECRVSERKGSIQSPLTIASVMFINDFLPNDCKRPWTLLFSSKLHGENFTFLTTRIIHQGPTVILVKDDCNYLFGGFSRTSWDVGPNFHGDEANILFCVRPSMNLYPSSGANNHYQYLNTNQHTIPNGLGMGGQFNYWGLWLCEDFTKGQSAESCTTFSGFKQLSAHKFFHVRHVEVWSVCERVVSMGAIMNFESSTILLNRSEERFMLELVGHNFRSDGELEDTECTD